jgi:hypothetical protein
MAPMGEEWWRTMEGDEPRSSSTASKSRFVVVAVKEAALFAAFLGLIVVQ